MKVIRAHDYAVRGEPQPDFRALRRILIALVVAAAFCLSMCVALILRGPVPQAARKTSPCSCTCR